MNLLQKVKLSLRNKVIIYALTRYLILFISFLTSVFLASKLGPYYFGIWGFILLLLNYYQYFDFGISDSATILLVQNKDNPKRVKDFETNSIAFSAIMGILAIVIAVYYQIFGIQILEKFHIGNLFYFVCLIAILAYLNKLFFKIYRVKGRMFEFGFYQSINSILVISIMFIAKERQLINLLISAYILGNLLSLILFIRGGGVSISGHPNFKDCSIIFNKGFMLFMYNFFFYLIILSTKTIISAYYTVEEFGFFTFSFTLANSILVLLDAFAVLIVPKVIDRLYSNDIKIIELTLMEIKINYVYLSYLLMCLALILFSVLLIFLPKYYPTFQVINMLSLAVVVSSNSFGYSMFLKAVNKEKTLAKISTLSLLTNIILAIILVKVLKVNYSYVSLSIILSYFLFAYLCAYYGKKHLLQSVSFFSILREILPLQLFVPALLIIIITILNIREFIFIPLLGFIIFNIKPIKGIFTTAKKILLNSRIFDIN